jgi:hypothetical protein
MRRRDLGRAGDSNPNAACNSMGLQIPQASIIGALQIPSTCKHGQPASTVGLQTPPTCIDSPTANTDGTVRTCTHRTLTPSTAQSPPCIWLNTALSQTCVPQSVSDTHSCLRPEQPCHRPRMGCGYLERESVTGRQRRHPSHGSLLTCTFQPLQLRYPLCNELSLGVKLGALQPRIKDAKIRLGIHSRGA